MVAWGFFVALWTGVGEGHWDNPNQWRLGFAIQSIPSLFLGIGVLFIGESPRWLLLKGRIEEAEHAFRGYHYNGTNDAWCKTEFTMMQVKSQRSLMPRAVYHGQTCSRLPPSGSDSSSDPSSGRRPCSAESASSIYYQTAIYSTLQYDQNQQLLISGLYGSVGPVACIASLFFVDRIGRKKILVTSSALPLFRT